MNDILEMAQGNLTRVIAVRLRPALCSRLAAKKY